MNKKVEGFIQTRGGKVWYEIVGNKKSTPLLVIHGGPGYPHDYLESLEDLANERQVIFYDQLGCGNSEWVDNKSLWNAEYFFEEIEKVVKALNLENYHILGQSWGAGIAAGFALTKPKGLKSLIFADPFLSTPIWIKDALQLLKDFPKSLQDGLKKSADSKEYKKATQEFYKRYVYRMDQFPVGVFKSEHKMNADLYKYMWGPEEFKPTGTLRDFDLTDRLSEIKVPVLLLCGRFDETTPESTEYFKSKMPNAKMKVFEKSAHMPHWTERKEYMKTVRNFLKSIK